MNFHNPSLGFAPYRGQVAGAGVLPACAAEAVLGSVDDAGLFPKKTSASHPRQESDGFGGCSGTLLFVWVFKRTGLLTVLGGPGGRGTCDRGSISLGSPSEC